MEDTHKKVFFFSGPTTKDLTPYPNGLVVHATFFFLCIFLLVRKQYLPPKKNPTFLAQKF